MDFIIFLLFAKDIGVGSPELLLVESVSEALAALCNLFLDDRLPTTVAALEEAIPWLQEQGYDLVTVTELIESSGQSIRYGEDYQRKPGR